MSDAKAKFEARRQKILARESRKSVSAVSDADDDIYLNIGEVKPKERPLAARRSLIQSGSSETPATPQAEQTESNETVEPEKKAENSEAKSETAKTETVVDEKPTKESSEETKVNTKEESEKSKDSDAKNTEDGDKSPKKSIKLPPAKTLAEIEQEVANATANFDNNALKKDKSEKSKVDEKAKKALDAVEKATTSSDPSHRMRFVRMLVIILLGIVVGYQTAHTSRMQAMNTIIAEATHQQVFDEFGSGDYTMSSSMPGATQSRTWVGYFQDKLQGQVECSLTAVGLAWWIAGFAKPFIQANVKQTKSKGFNPLEFVMGFLNGWQEVIYSTLGEISLHFFVLVMTVVIYTIVFSGSVRTPAAVPNTDEL